MPCGTEAACDTNRKKKHFDFFFNLKISRGKDSSLPVEVFLSQRRGPHQVPPWQVSASIKGLLPGASAQDEGALVGRCWDTRGPAPALLSLGRGAFRESGVISPSPVSLVRPCSLLCTPSPPTRASFSLLNPLMGLGRALPLSEAATLRQALQISGLSEKAARVSWAPEGHLWPAGSSPPAPPPRLHPRARPARRQQFLPPQLSERPAPSRCYAKPSRSPHRCPARPRQGASTCRGRHWKAGTAWADGNKSPCGLCNHEPSWPRLPWGGGSQTPRNGERWPLGRERTEGHSFKEKQVILSDCPRSFSRPKVLSAPRKTDVPCTCWQSAEVSPRHEPK